MINTIPISPAKEAEIQQLQAMAKAVRKGCLTSIASLGIGHIGGSMSVVEALVILYFRHMRLDGANDKSPDRDMFVLSKGHAGPALYATLVEKGFLRRELLGTLNRGGTSLPSHADRKLTPGVDMSTGSLGQGFSAATGIALGLRMDKPRPDGSVRRCWAIIGDGESDEGQVWEAAAFAAHYKLDNLIAFTDCNKYQIDGSTDSVMGLGDLAGKWEAFGWKAINADGHDFAALDKAIMEARTVIGKPVMIILDTIKAKGIPAYEGKPESHNAPFGQPELDAVLKAMESEEARNV